jgi:ribosomal protein S18 acetylase RimI-like enzyme
MNDREQAGSDSSPGGARTPETPRSSPTPSRLPSAGGVWLKEVATHSDLKQFIRFPFSLYRDHPCWVPPLIMDELHTLRREKNPAFEYCDARYWLAYKNGRVAGRIAGLINQRYIEKWGHRYARFGWIDFIDDREVVGALFGAVEQWAGEKGMTGIHGPLGFTDMDREGMLVEGFGELGTMATIYNHPYYPGHLEALGYGKDADWLEFEVRVPAQVPEKAERVEQIVMRRLGVHVLPAKNAREIRPYARELFAVLNQAYARLYAFVPLSTEQIDTYVKQYFSFIQPDFTKILLDANGRVAGFVVAMPSLSRALQKCRGRLFPFGFLHLLAAMRKPKTLDLYLGAVRPDLQNKGADALVMTAITRSAIARGIVSAESNVELEVNVAVQNHWKYYEARQHKRRRCYLKRWA